MLLMLMAVVTAEFKQSTRLTQSTPNTIFELFAELSAIFLQQLAHK